MFTQTHMLFYMQIDLHLQFNIVWLCSIIMMIIQDNYVIIKLSSHINVCVNINKAIVCTSLKIGAEVRIYMKHHQLNLFFSRAQSAHWFPVSWILGEPTMDDVFAARPSGFQVNFRDFWRINPRIHNNIWYYILIHTLYAHDNWLFTSWFGMKNLVSFMFLRHENFNHTFPGIYHCSVQFSPKLRVITMVSG